MVFSSSPFLGCHRILPSRTARPGPSWPSPEQGGGESKATVGSILSIFLAQTKHHWAVLTDTLDLFMEKLGAVWGLCSAILTPPSFFCFCPLPAAKSVFPVKGVLLFFLVWAGSGLIAEKFSEESSYHRCLQGTK